MTNSKKTGRGLIASILSIFVCFSMLLGSTFAWFTDSVTSTGNKIVSGTLSVDLELLDKESDTWSSIKQTNAPVFEYENWEPGYTAVRLLKVENNGTLALKWKASFLSENELSALADVIDVYVRPYGVLADDTSVEYPQDSKLTDYVCVGTLGEFVNTIEATTYGNLQAGESAYLGIALKMREDAGNEYQGLDFAGSFDISVLATQLSSEGDSYGSEYDKGATYPSVKVVVLDNQTAEPVKMNAGKMTLTLPKDAAAGAYEFGVSNWTETANDEGDTVLGFDLELLKDGVKISDDGTEYTVSMFVGEGFNLKGITHNGEEIDYNFDPATGEVSFKVTSFSPFTVTYVDVTEVSNADELVEALENGWNVRFLNDISIDPASMSNAYGKTGISIKQGQTVDGGNYTLDIEGAGGTWDSGINTTGGTIKNITVTGSFRGVFVNHNSTHSETVVLENVTIDGTTYTISCDQGKNQNLIAKNSTFNGWTSYAATIGTAEFDGCSFGEGNGYAYMRPYAPTTYKNCKFEAGFEIDARAKVTFENCKLDGVLITEANLAQLVTSNTQNAGVK